MRFLLCFWIVIIHCSHIKKNHKKYLGKGFHVPTFIFLSFYFYYPTISEKNINKVISRFQRLLIPYILWPLIRIILSLKKYKEQNILRNMFIQLLIGISIHNIFWFQFNLIFLTLFFAIILFAFNKNSIKILIFLGLICFYLHISELLYVILIYYTKFFRNNIGSLIELMPISVNGCIFSSLNLLLILDNLPIFFHFILSFITFLLFKYTIFVKKSGFRYSNVSLNILSSLILFLLFGTISFENILKYKYIILFIRYITEFTGGIYYLHPLILDYFNENSFKYLKKNYFDSIIIYNICFFICFFGNKLFKNYKLKYLFIYYERNSTVDKDMIGLRYPEIQYQNIRNDYINERKSSSFLKLLNQLEIKLIYLEKEINATKLVSFFIARILFLKEHNVTYNDSKINEYNEIINWLIIHKSTQLKGIASDKYLSCKYVKMKLGKDLCPHRIGVYNSVEEINFEKLIKIGNIVLKISNGNNDNIFIPNTTKLEDLEKLKENVLFHFNRNYPLHIPSLFHLFTKKRIILEKMFIPITDLYEFKILLFNCAIKMIILQSITNKKMTYKLYDENFKAIKDKNIGNDIISKFSKKTLNKLKDYAVKLSEDFPNFIRVDLYIFHNKIYLSELTFDSHAGIPTFKKIKYFNDGVKKWKRVDY